MNGAAAYAVSPYQKQLWLANGQHPAFRTQTTVRLRTVTVDRVRATLEALADRYDILRTQLAVPGPLSVPVQVVEPGYRALMASVESTEGDEVEITLEAPAILLDATSLDLLVDEFSRRIHDDPVVAPAAPFAQYAVWRAQTWASHRDRSSSPISAGSPGFDPQRVPVSLPAALIERAGALGVTPGELLFVAWANVVAMRSQAQCPHIVDLRSDRPLPELDRCLGLLVRPVSVAVEGVLGASVHEAVASLDAAERDPDLDVVGPHRSYGFQVRVAPDVPFLVTHRKPATSHLERFRFSMEAIVADGEIGAALVYDAATVAATVARRVAEQCGLTVERLLEPRPRSSGLVPVGPIERSERLIEAKTAPAPLFEPFIEEVRRLAAAQPDATALRGSGGVLVRAELERRSAVLAATLRGAGAVPEAIVGVLGDRSSEAVVALLAVLTTGAAFLILDPELPEQRLALMVQEARPVVVLAQPGHLDLAHRISGHVIALDASAWTGSVERDGQRMPPVHPDSMAYVLYTSGSTGRAKGVAVTQAGLSNYVAWAAEAYAMHDRAAATVHTSLAFDLTVTSLLAPLAAGCPVDIVPPMYPAAALDALLKLPGDGRLLKLTPSQLRLLTQLAEPDAAARASLLVVGGEELRTDDVAAWRALAPGVTIVNEYGPTETVVGCAAYTVPCDVVPGCSVPLGRPIRGASVLLLDDSFELVTSGVDGELFVGGIGVARGYIANPGLTAERFVPDPYGPPGARLYRTGDRGRIGDDGHLYYRGRNDRQVKIHGHRIELAEVEAVLLRCAGVRAAAAIQRPGAVDNSTLIAYVVGEIGDIAAVRSHAAQHLPAVAVPHDIVVLDALPLTVNGKVDHRTLPAVVRDRAVYVPPANDLEEVIALAWSEVLGTPNPSVTESFFDVGGTSFSVVVLNRLLCRRLKVGLPVVSHFEYPSIRSLAEHVASGVDDTTAIEAGAARALRRMERRERQRLEPKAPVR